MTTERPVRMVEVTMEVTTAAPPDRLWTALVDETEQWWVEPYVIGDNRRALRLDGAFRQRPSFDRSAGTGALRDARAASRLVAKDGHRRMDQRVCPHRA